MSRSPWLFALLRHDSLAARLLFLGLVSGGACWALWSAGVLSADSPLGLRILAAVVAGGGLASVVWAGVRLHRLRRVLRRGIAVAGDVIAVKGRSEGAWQVVFGFRLGAQYHESKIVVTDRRPAWKVGDAVALLVDPRRPAQAVVRAMWEGA